MFPNWYERIASWSAAKPGGAAREILIIDDQEDAREMLVALLGRMGWATQRASCGREALAVMAAHQDTVGLALVDVILPDFDGISLARELREKYPRLGIVLLSGGLNDESRWIVSEEGFRFLPKPFKLRELQDVVADMLGDADVKTAS